MMTKENTYMKKSLNFQIDRLYRYSLEYVILPTLYLLLISDYTSMVIMQSYWGKMVENAAMFSSDIRALQTLYTPYVFVLCFLIINVLQTSFGRHRLVKKVCYTLLILSIFYKSLPDFLYIQYAGKAASFSLEHINLLNGLVILCVWSLIPALMDLPFIDLNQKHGTQNTMFDRHALMRCNSCACLVLIGWNVFYNSGPDKIAVIETIIASWVGCFVSASSFYTSSPSGLFGDIKATLLDDKCKLAITLISSVFFACGFLGDIPSSKIRILAYLVYAVGTLPFFGYFIVQAGYIDEIKEMVNKRICRKSKGEQCSPGSNTEGTEHNRVKK